MSRRSLVFCKVFVAALFALGLSVASPHYTLSAQGAIGQVKGDPTGATTGTAADVTVAEVDVGHSDVMTYDDTWAAVHAHLD